MSLFPLRASVWLVDQCCFLALCPDFLPTQLVARDWGPGILIFAVDSSVVPLTQSSMFLIGLWSFYLRGWVSGCVRFEAEWSRWRLHCIVSPACLCSVFTTVFSHSQNKKTPSPVLLAGSIMKFIVRYFACISGQGLGCSLLRD